MGQIIPPQPLVWINGWPEVGKRTVAQFLVQILGEERAVLVNDSELAQYLALPPECESAHRSGTSDIAVSGQAGDASISGSNKTGHGSDHHPDPVCERQAACFRKYVEDPQALGRIVVFTDCRGANEDDGAGAREYEEAARRSGRPFVPVYMDCELEANVQRSQTSERRYSLAASKMLSPTELRELRAKNRGRLYMFPPDERPGLCVDVTSQGTHDTAMQILAFVREAADKQQRAGAKNVDVSDGTGSAATAGEQEREP